MSATRLAVAFLTASLLALSPAHAGELSPPVSDSERIASFLMRIDGGSRTFVSEATNDPALGAAVRAWAGRAEQRRVASLAAVVIPGSSGEKRLVQALSKWTGTGRIAAPGAVEAAAAFLNDATEKAERLLADPRVKSEIDAAVESVDQTRAVVRAQELSRRKLSDNVFERRQVQNLNPGGAAGSHPGIAPGAKRIAADPNLPSVVLPMSLKGGPDRFNVPSPASPAAATKTEGGTSSTPAGEADEKAPVPNDGRVVPAEPMSAWERVKDSVKHPMSDAYGFTFEGTEAQPVSFRDHAPALAYVKKAKAGAFTKVTLYGHGAPGMMTVGSWSGDADEIASRFKGKMARGSTLEIKGCNTSSVGGASVNPGRGLSSLTRRVLYFSIPYLMEGRDEKMREMLEDMWDSDLARDASRGLPGVKVCGLRTFGLVGDRIPVVGALLGRREATDSNAILGSKACFIDGREIEN